MRARIRWPSANVQTFLRRSAHEWRELLRQGHDLQVLAPVLMVSEDDSLVRDLIGWTLCPHFKGGAEGDAGDFLVREDGEKKLSKR